MGARDTHGVRKVTRGGKPRLVIDFQFRNNDGRLERYRRDASVQTSAGAASEAQRLRLYAAEHGTLDLPDRSPTFAAFVDERFAALFLPKFRPATRTRYEALLRQGMRDAFGSHRLDDIDATEIRAYAAQLAHRGVQPRGPLNLLRTILGAAVELGALGTLPTFPATRASRKVPDAPSTDEVGAMLQHAKGWLRIAVALASYAGLRSGEVRALEVRDVDLPSARLHVRRALSEDEVTTPKSGHERVVPLFPELQAILTRLKATLARHDLPQRSFHQLRHFFCSALVSRGASVEAVRLLAGHSNLATTQRYVHATGDELRGAIAMFGNQPETQSPADRGSPCFPALFSDFCRGERI